MSFIEELSASLERRLRELEGEIASLHAARQALVGRRRRPARSPMRRNSSAAAKAAPDTAVDHSPSTSDHPSSTAYSPTPPTSAPVALETPGAATAADRQPASQAPRRGAPASDASGPGEGASAERARVPRRPRMSDDELEARLEELLGEAPDGLSAVTLAKRAGVSFARVSAVLQRMARDGRAQASGTRRTSLWRLISEEQLIAQRAAELERLSARSA
jgi:hypothetical protein